MGIFLNKNVKSSLGRKKLILSYAAVAGCIILIIVNLVFFLWAETSPFRYTM